MSRRLPSLSGLQAFEAAARHLSFTLAAEELHLTQSAVSRRIRQLEAFLDIDLFHRRTRSIDLTEAGGALLARASYILDEIGEIGGGIGRVETMRCLTLSTLPTLATEWLMPRLHEFTQHEGNADVRILTSIEPVEFSGHGPDASIRVGRLPGRDHGSGPRIDLTMTRDWPRVHTDFLFEDRMVPVCAPALLDGALLDGMTRLPVARLLQLPLIHTTSRRHAWSDWLRSQGMRRVPRPDPTLEFGHFFMSLQAARNGRGVALLPDIVVAHAMNDGLVCPTPVSVPSAGDYFLLLPKERLRDPTLAAFRRWLLAEAHVARFKIAGYFSALHTPNGDGPPDPHAPPP